MIVVVSNQALCEKADGHADGWPPCMLIWPILTSDNDIASLSIVATSHASHPLVVSTCWLMTLHYYV